MREDIKNGGEISKLENPKAGVFNLYTMPESQQPSVTNRFVRLNNQPSIRLGSEAVAIGVVFVATLIAILSFWAAARYVQHQIPSRQSEMPSLAAGATLASTAVENLNLLPLPLAAICFLISGLIAAVAWFTYQNVVVSASMKDLQLSLACLSADWVAQRSVLAVLDKRTRRFETELESLQKGSDPRAKTLEREVAAEADSLERSMLDVFIQEYNLALHAPSQYDNFIARYQPQRIAITNLDEVAARGSKPIFADNEMGDLLVVLINSNCYLAPSFDHPWRGDFIMPLKFSFDIQTASQRRLISPAQVAPSANEWAITQKGILTRTN